MMELFIALVMVTAVSSLSVSTGVQKSFIENEVVPDVLTTAPAIKLSVTYPCNVVVNLGNELQPISTKDKPTVKWHAEKGAFYSLAKVDPDGPTRANPLFREIRHWLVMNIPGTDVANGDEVVEYIGAGPPNGTGLHRYVYLVFKQPNGKIDHDEPRATRFDLDNRPKTSTVEFMQKYNLSNPEYGNFYQAQYDDYAGILLAQIGFQA